MTFILNGRFINKAGVAFFFSVCYGVVDFNTCKHRLKECPADFLFFFLLHVFILLDRSERLSCVLNNLRTDKPQLFLTVF